ncbi:TonB-dependent receptor domain-containing protein [Parasediminibacterium paludis]|uniref:TonB-dependent receptor domain-containing protein n=1 Tax=Parasediminibacterium paludis TaxID=908966 RepID=A0ABV8Q101_9BACT
MKKIITLLTALGLLSFTSQAQNNSGKINGAITSGTKPLEAATINLLRAKDSSIVKIAVSNKDGNFEIEKVANAKYLVAVQSIGYKKYYSDVFEITTAKNVVTLPSIVLTVMDKQLSDVVVTSKKPLVEIKLDRTIVNVEASVTNVGATALEVLEKSPGITVDKDGNISLKGKSGVVVLVDGKPSYLGAADLANMLRSMSSNQLDQIEIMTNPPAKYDASGNAGIINIKTKKNKIKGLNGSITAGYGQGVFPKANQSFNMNYRDGKLNLFGNYSYNYRKGFQDLDLVRKFLDNSKQLASTFSQTSNMTDERNSHSAKFGADFFATKNTTYGFVINGFNNNTSRTGYNNTLVRKVVGADTITIASTPTKETFKNLSTNFNFRHQFDTTGKEMTVDLDYGGYDIKNIGMLSNQYFDANYHPILNNDTLNSNLPTKINIYSAKSDFTLPLKKGAKFEAGFKFSYVETDNNAQYDSLINNQSKPDYNRSNHFLYKENVNAVYVNYSKQLNKKWAMQLGLRLENTHAKGDQFAKVLIGNATFDTTYTQLFPTAYISYTLNDKNQFSLNYGRRINRPDYESLNPFVQFIDKYTFEQGNPGLKPQFSDNIELSHLFMGGAISTTLNYTKVNNIIQQVIEQHTATNETFVKQANIATLDQFGIAIAGQAPIAKWWNLNIYTNFYTNRFRGLVNNAYVDLSSPTFLLNASNTFKLGKGWNAELSGFYRSEGLEGVMYIRPLGNINVGISKSVLNNKGSIRLNVRDIFWMQQPSGYAKYGDIDLTFKNRNDNRVANISFTYRFSKGKIGNTQRNRSSVDEASRVKSGN